MNILKIKKIYSFIDVYRLVSSLLIKSDMKVVSERTIRNDIALLKKLGIIKTYIIRHSKNKGSDSFYIQIKENWDLRFSILRKYFEKEIVTATKYNRIKNKFKDAFERENSKINFSSNSLISDVLISDVVLCTEDTTKLSLNKNSSEFCAKDSEKRKDKLTREETEGEKKNDSFIRENEENMVLNEKKCKIRDIKAKL